MFAPMTDLKFRAASGLRGFVLFLRHGARREKLASTPAPPVAAPHLRIQQQVEIGEAFMDRFRHVFANLAK